MNFILMCNTQTAERIADYILTHADQFGVKVAMIPQIVGYDLVVEGGDPLPFLFDMASTLFSDGTAAVVVPVKE